MEHLQLLSDALTQEMQVTQISLLLYHTKRQTQNCILSVNSELIAWLLAIAYTCCIPVTLMCAIGCSEMKAIISSYTPKIKFFGDSVPVLFPPMYIGRDERIPRVLQSSSFLIYLISSYFHSSNVFLLCLLGKAYFGK